MIRSFIKRFHRLITYGIVGVINTAVDFLVFTAFEAFLLLPVEVNQAAGYAAGVVCSFLLNRSVTFKKGSTTRLSQQIMRFVIVNGISLAVSMVMIRWLTGLAVHVLIAKVTVTAVTMAINYVGYKLYVFMIRENDGN